jgi:hypothetical protein
MLWEWVSRIADCEEYANYAVALLNRYCNGMGIATENELLVLDKSYIVDIIKSINTRNIEFALVIRGLVYWWTKKGISSEDVDKSILKTNLWRTYLLLEDGYFYFGGEYEEYEDYRSNRLNEFAAKLEKKDIPVFIDNVTKIINSSNNINEYQIINGLEKIISESCKLQQNEEEFADKLYLADDNIDICPNELIRRLFELWGKDTLYDWLMSNNNRNRNKWLFAYFEEYPEAEVSEKEIERLTEYMKEESDKEIVSSPYRKMHFLDKFRTISPDIYVVISRIILSKTSYSQFIVSIYFGLLFHDNIYTPEELEHLYKTDLSVLQEVYFTSVGYGRTVDLHGIFLKYFIQVDPSWVEHYADHICDDGDKNVEIYRAKTLWQMADSKEFFTKVFEYGYNRSKPYLWRFESSFEKLLLRMEGNTEVYSRQKEWILEAVSKYATDEKVRVIFSMSCEMEEDLRREMVRIFLVNNKDYEAFSHLRLEPNHWGGTGSMIPDMQRKKEYMESLLPLVNGLDFLEHKKLVKSNVQVWDMRIKHEQMEEIIRHIYM